MARRLRGAVGLGALLLGMAVPMAFGGFALRMLLQARDNASRLAPIASRVEAHHGRSPAPNDGPGIFVGTAVRRGSGERDPRGPVGWLSAVYHTRSRSRGILVDCMFGDLGDVALRTDDEELTIEVGALPSWFRGSGLTTTDSWPLLWLGRAGSGRAATPEQLERCGLSGGGVTHHYVRIDLAGGAGLVVSACRSGGRLLPCDDGGNAIIASPLREAREAWLDSTSGGLVFLVVLIGAIGGGTIAANSQLHRTGRRPRA